MTSLPIQTGFNGRFFPNNWRPAGDEIAFARSAGFSCIQFPGPEAGLDAERLGDSLERVAALLQDNRVTAVMEIPVHVDGNGLTGSGATPLDVLRLNLPAITILSCPYVHWHLVPRERLAPAAQQALEIVVVPQLAQAVALAQAHHFRFGLEHNAPNLPLFATPDRIAAVLTAVPNLGFVWDLNHTLPAHLASFQALALRMNVLHVSDTPLPKVNYHLPLGLGAVDLAAYLRPLLRVDFRGPAILEIGGAPWSGGFGQDTDEALIDSNWRLRQAVKIALGLAVAGEE